MINSKIYLEETQKIAENWEKQFDRTLHRTQNFLQINGIVFSIIFFKGFILDGIEDLVLPLILLGFSAIMCLVILFPAKTKEVDIEVTDWIDIEKNDPTTIYNDLIHQYRKKIKSFKTICYIHTIFFITVLFSFGLGIIFLGIEIFK